MSTSELDLNLVVLCGRLAVDAEHQVFDSGSRLIRYLVLVTSVHPRHRLDVVPVTLWNPTNDVWDRPGERGDRVWLCGSVQRRYWEDHPGRRSRIEIIAEQVRVGDVGDLEPVRV